MRVLPFSLLAALLIASVVEQPEISTGVPDNVQPAEQVGEQNADKASEIVIAQAEPENIPTLFTPYATIEANERAEIGDSLEELNFPVVEDLLSLDEDGKLPEIDGELASTNGHAQTLEYLDNPAKEEQPEGDSHSSASASVSEDDDEETNSESASLASHSEDEDRSQATTLETRDEPEAIEQAAQIVLREPTQSLADSISTESIEEVDVRRPQVPQDIRIWPILIKILQTPFIMEMLTWSSMILFVVILFHHILSDY